MRRTHAKAAAAVVLALSVMSVASCGSSSTGSSGTGSAGTAPAASTGAASDNPYGLPASVLAKGALDIAVFVPYPPYTTAGADGQPGGLEPELMTAVAKKLGMTPNYHSMKFEAMIPSVVNGRNDVMIGVMADTDERRKEVDFTDFYKTAFKAIVAAGNPKGVDAADLCGTTIAEAPTSVQYGIVKQLSADCTKAGKKAIKLLGLANPTDDLISITNGRTDAALVDPIQGTYLVQQQPKDYQMLEPVISAGSELYAGWLYKKGNTELTGAVTQAVLALKQDGTWDQIMAKYGATDVAIDPIRVNTEPVGS